VLYEGMPAGLRAALHLQAARMLAGAGTAPERVAAQLVSGGLNAGGEDWVVAWLADAAAVLIYRSPQVAEELLRAVLGQLSVGDRRRQGLEASLVADRAVRGLRRVSGTGGDLALPEASRADDSSFEA